MSMWKNSIVTYIDLVGIKDATEDGNSKATDIMRKMHSLAERALSDGMANYDHCYIWNDSVLLLSVLDSLYKNANENDIMKDADNLKKKIESLCSCYAVSVKGQIFPDESIFYAPRFNGQIAGQPRVVRLKASSYAMGNCFIIEGRLGKKLKKPWYVDSRIAKKLDSAQTRTIHSVKMLPKNKARDVWVYDGHLW